MNPIKSFSKIRSRCFRFLSAQCAAELIARLDMHLKVFTDVCSFVGVVEKLFSYSLCMQNAYCGCDEQTFEQILANHFRSLPIFKYNKTTLKIDRKKQGRVKGEKTETDFTLYLY